MTMLLILMFLVTKVGAQEGPGLVTAHPGQDVELLCNVTGGVASWSVNGGQPYTPNDLFMGDLAGHNISLTGRNIIVEDIMMIDDRNGSVYICIVPQGLGTPDIESDPTTLLVAGVPGMVPSVTVDDSTININRNVVTLTLSWGEPFNNLDPIVNYTVSCSGDVTCPPNFTTTDNTTRNYTITNLTTMTNYIFSVVATNSIGSGKAGEFNCTTCTPVIGQVTGVRLTCEPVDLSHQCTVTWDPIAQGDITGYQVYYNGTIINVNSSTTTLTFTAPLLPDGVFTGTAVVIVTAMNRFGIGPPSNSTAQIYGSDANDSIVFVSDESTDLDVTVISSSIMNPLAVNITINTINTTTINIPYGLFIIVTSTNVSNMTGDSDIMLPNTASTLSLTVICIIHPNSPADTCEVMARPDGQNMRVSPNTSSIINRTATVTINGLMCEVAYTITAGGTLNGQLVGPRSSLGSIPAELCEIIASVGGGDNEDNIGGIVGGVVGGTVGGLAGVTGAVVFVIWFRKRKRSSRQDTGGMPLTSPKVKPSETDSAAFKEEAKKVNEGPTDEYAQIHKPPKKQQPKQMNEGPTDEYAQVHKPSKGQQPKQIEGGINYADLEIQRGPKQQGGGNTAVTYGQVTETRQ